jgi:large subunit ribosomal protein L29
MAQGTKMVEIRDRSNDELNATLARAKDELFRLKLNRFTNQLENVMQIRNKRREVARIMTVLSARAAGKEAVGAHPKTEETKEAK